MKSSFSDPIAQGGYSRATQKNTDIEGTSKNNPCKVCGKTDWCYTLADEKILRCYRSTDAPIGYRVTRNQPNDGTTQFALNKGNSEDFIAKQEAWAKRKEDRDRNLAKAKEEELKGLLTAEERDPLIRKLSAEIGLTGHHSLMLKERGLSREQIKAGLFFSIEQWQKVPNWAPLNLPGVYLSKFGDKQLNGKGIAIPTFSHDGLATGWQILNDEPRPKGESNYVKYRWAKGEVGSQLPIGQGEQPIQVTKPLTAKVEEIWLLEGVLKPFVAASIHNICTIGVASGLFRAAPVQVRKALSGVTKVIIGMDAGDLVNPHRVRHWRAEVEWLESIGKEVKIAWWGQKTKDDDDLDERSNLEGIKYISVGEWLVLAEKAAKKIEDLGLYLSLSRYSKEVAEERSEANLQVLPLPRAGTFQFISSPVATGKTKQLASTIDNWQRSRPNGRIFMLGYRNGLLDNAGQRLGFPSYRVGNGCDDAAIASFPKLRICLDSLLRLSLEDIPAGSLIILDECEAILAHGASGGTTGSKAAEIQAHFVAILHRVLATSGAVIGLEDSLTDVSVGGLQDLTGRLYPAEVIINDAERFSWNVRFGRASQGEKIAYILDRLRAGETIAVPTTSQRFGEALERMVVAAMPELALKVVRLDAKTSPDLHDLKSDPDAWLEQHGTRLLIYSSVVESGFSIEKYHFDRVVANFSNLSTRTHLQMLSRVRSNVPRDIFISCKGAEAAQNRGADPKKLWALRQGVANKTSLRQGFGRIKLSQEAQVWNWLDCQFAGRSALSAKYLDELLVADLQGRGHQVVGINWAELEFAEGISPAELKVQYKEVIQAIEQEENKALADADGLSMKAEVAHAILHSTESSFEKRQQARKCLLHEELPGIELTEDFLLETVTKDRGAYKRACTLGFMIDNPRLAEKLDCDAFAKQRSQPHILLKRVPQMQQKVSLLREIKRCVDAVMHVDYYTNESPEVLAVQEIALRNAYDFWALFGMRISPESVAPNQKRVNTAITTFNKIAKKLGYESEPARKIGPRRDRTQTYRIKNGDCPHRQSIIEALGRKYEEEMRSLDGPKEEANSHPASTTSNIENLILDGVDTGGVEPKILHVCGGTGVHKSTVDREGDKLSDMVSRQKNNAARAKQQISN